MSIDFLTDDKTTFHALPMSTEQLMMILYVEDEFAHVELARRTLEDNLRGEFVLLHAASIQAALTILDLEPEIDLVLTDLRLPDGSGLDLLLKLRDRKSPPAVVLVTGQGDEEVAVAALKAGAADYLVKQSDYLYRLPVVLTNAIAQNRLLREQAAVQESEERFRRIFHASPIATCVVTLEEGRFIDANLSFLNLTGLSLENLIGRTSLELGFWERKDDREDMVRRLKEQGSLKGVEIHYKNVPNGPRDALAYYELVDLGGQPCVLAMFYDVTEQKNSQKAVQAERDFALQILNNMGQGLTVSALDGSFEYVNPAYAVMLGYSADEIIGKSPADFFAPADLEILNQEQIKRRNGTASTYEARLVHKNGQEVPVTITAVPRWQDGTIAGTIAVITDLTARKRTEEALARQVKELTVLHAVTVAGAESDSEDEIIERIVKIVTQIYGEVCGVLLLNEEGNTLKPHPSYSGTDISNWMDGIQVTMGITGKAVSLGKTLRLGDVAREAGYIEIAPGIRSEICVPIRVNRRIIGVFNVESRKSNAFDEEDERFLNTVAGSLGTALERLRLFKEEQQRAKELDALYQATKPLTQSLQPTVIAENLLAIMDNLLGYDFASIHLLDKHSHSLIPLSTSQKTQNLEIHEKEMELLGTGKRSLGEGIIGWVAQHGQPIRTGDVSKDERYLPVIKNIASELCVPLISRGSVIGVISIETTKPNAYSERDENLLSALATHAASAIENARLFEAEQKRRQEAENLRQAAAAISSTLDLNSVLEDILKALKKVIYYNSASAFLLEGSWLRLAICQGFSKPEELINQKFPSNDELFLLVKKAKKPVIIEDVRQDPRFKGWGESARVRGWMSIPLIARGEVIGYITLDSHEVGTYSEAISDTAMAFANQAAAAIENARLYDETQRRLNEMETINRISSSLRTTQSQAEMLDIFLDETLSLLKAEHGSVWLYDHSSNTHVQRAARGVARKVKYNRLRPGEGIVSHVFQTGEVYTTTDLKKDSLLFKPNLDIILPGYGGACIPIKSTAGTLGAVMIQMESSRQIMEHISLLTTLAEIVGNSIHRAELYEQSLEQVRRLTTLRDIDSAIASSTDLRVTLNILTDHALKHLRVDAVDIMLYHPELQSLTYLTSAGFNTPAPSRPLIRIGEGLAGQVVMKGRTDHVTDLQNSSEVKRDPLLLREGFVTYIGVPLIVKGQIKGVFEVFHRSALSPNAEWMQFLHTLAGQAAIAIDNSQLFHNLQRSNQELTQAYDTTLEGWARALELRDRETEGHTRRVTDLTLRLARFMGVGEDELVNIYRGVLLHDIGKMGVPDHILKKTGTLTDEEWAEMRRHPQYAYDLLSPIQFLRPALDIPYSHHEHWDGGGYPRGLMGEQIPLSARIFAVVDIWDALLSDRPYRKAWPRNKVVKYLKDVAGVILDPKVVEAFLKVISEEENGSG
jgi:PAS domain S-box-containing protein